MRVGAVAVVGVLISGWGLDAAIGSSAIQAARRVPEEQTVLKVEGMT